MPLYSAIIPTPLAPVCLTATETCLTRCHLLLDGSSRDTAAMGRVLDTDEAVGACAPLRLGRDWLLRYFGGENPPAEGLPLAPAGTAFAALVRRAMLDIPFGRLTTYGNIAALVERATGKRSSARAVGQCVGSNPFVIIVPCHRVVGAGGKLTGFAYGLDIKRWLLRHEGHGTYPSTCVRKTGPATGEAFPEDQPDACGRQDEDTQEKW